MTTKTTKKTSKKKPLISKELELEFIKLKDNIPLLIVSFLLFPLGLLLSFNSREKNKVLCFTYLGLSILSLIIFLIFVISLNRYNY